MSNIEYTDRLEALRLMIIELAKGNFAKRLPVFGDPDGLQEFEILLNLLAEELGSFLIHPSSFREKNIDHPFVFVIDENYTIRGINSRFKGMLGYTKDELIGHSIREFIQEECLEAFLQQIRQYSSTSNLTSSFKTLCTFYTAQQQLLACWGYGHGLWDGENYYYVFRGLPIAYREKESPQPLVLEATTAYPSLQFQSDIQKIRKVHRFVLENLHQKLPSLVHIARKFHLNEYKLKSGFKVLYQTTIFRFHRSKRLELAMVMIRYTPTSLKEVAAQFGFRSVPHFSKVFKDKYGKSPKWYKMQRRK